MSSKHLFASFLSPLELNEYIAFDLETTGLNPQKDCITEIAACRFINGKIQDRYTTLINPGITVPNNIVEITGITDDMLSDAPSIEDALPKLIKFLGHSPLVGHNLDFDYAFIKESCTKNGISFPDVYMYDTLSLARTFIYFHNSFSLTSLCDYYNISIDQAHRAGADALSTGRLFIYLLQEAISRPLRLIEKINIIIKNSKHAYNRQLFSNIIKTAVRMNSVDGLMEAISEYKLPTNICNSDDIPMANQLPDSPLEWFADDGLITSNWQGYEKRLPQLEFIQDAYTAFSENYILIAEAGTGLGKSMGYLSAGLLAARKNDRSLVVSTHTKNLQEQLFEKDIPQLAQSLDININTVIYKGRNNYICQNRLANLINNHTHLLKLY